MLLWSGQKEEVICCLLKEPINIKGNRHTNCLTQTGEFPGSSAGKESDCNAGDPGLIPGSGSSLGEGNGNPLQYFCLGNPMDRGAWQATVYGILKSQDTTE